MIFLGMFEDFSKKFYATFYVPVETFQPISILL